MKSDLIGKPRKYPYLALNRRNKIVVLFSRPGVAILLHDADEKMFPGMISVGEDELEYEVLRGRVVLSNE